MIDDVEVFSSQRWNDTGVDVKRSQRIEVTATGEWIDWTIRCDANGFERPHMNAFKFARRNRGAPWFALIASVGKMKRPTHHVGSSGDFVASRDGRLYLFANDAWYFYFNNKGSVRASIRVVDP